ncbi:MAG: hypothetical protein LDL11_04120 [Desulfarculus sp.]|nr:hypothetical protein [Desulfarculus sp.]
MVDPDARRGKARTWPSLLLLTLGLVVLALLHTDPLWRFWREGIPYGYHVVPGYERVPLMPGDHLQFLYWCWLLVDNLLGPSALFTNPYEFNTFLTPQGMPGFANFPFSLLYVALHPLGQTSAYNALVIGSYLLAGLAAFALAREVLDDPRAAWPAAVVFALLPFRASQALSGHLYGFVAFLLPLTLWCLERGLKRRSLAWGLGAGLCLLAMARMEGHLIYYTALLLGLYLPLRLLLAGAEATPPAEPTSLGGGLIQALWPALAGLGLGATGHLMMIRTGGAAFWSPGLVETLALYLLLALVAWLLLSWLAAALTSLDLTACRALLGRALAPLALAPIYAVQFVLDWPHLGAGLLLVLALAGLLPILPRLWRARRRPALPAGWWRPVPPLALGLAGGAIFMIHVKRSIFAASIAHQGRGLDEVRLFSPHLADLFDPANVHMERLIFSGWGLMILALAGLARLLPARPRPGAALASLWAGLGLLFVLLALGPSLPALPLYQSLYRWLPYFNFPRVPGRMILMAVLMLALLAGWVWRAMLARLPGRRWPTLAALGLAALLAVDLWPPTPVGICLLPPSGPVETAIRQELPPGAPSAQRLLGLPIWPGDSHQSSIYELTIARTGATMVNGYSPVVPRAYLEQVYQPLYPLDLGLVDAPALAMLRRLNVPLITFHDDEMVYPAKVSPFPPALARQRLLASGALELAVHDGNVFLLRLRPEARPDPAPAAITSPVTSLWEAESLRRDTGQLVEDRAASGWGLMFTEAATVGGPLGPRHPRAAGNLVSARAGLDRPGFLSFGPYKAFPPGEYQAVFRLRRGAGPIPGHVEVVCDQGRRVLARQELDPDRLPADGLWHDLVLPFSLADITVIELRTAFAGVSDLDLDLILVRFADALPADGFFRAQDLRRQTGDLAADPRVPGGLAVLARAGHHPPLYLMHGPQQTLEPGRYRASFRLAADGSNPPGAVLADLVVATDLGRIPLGHRVLTAADLGPDYQDIAVDFTLARRLETDYRVRNTGRGSFRLAGVSVRRVE